MTIPVSTTTLSIERPSASVDAFEEAVYSTVASGVPAHVSSPTGGENRGVGTQESVDAVIYVDWQVDVQRQDRITDELTDDIWDVSWTRTRRGLGLDHRVIGVTRTKGSISG